MRIRKHASKILGSASCQAWLSSPVSRGDDAEGLQGDVCELNRSPWDVTPSTSPCRSNPDPDRSRFEVEEEDKGILGNAFGEAEAFCVFPSSGEATRKEEAAMKKEIIRKEKVQVEMVEKKKKAKGKTKKKKKKTSGKQAAEEMENDDITVASFKRCGKSCNKTDGKGWRCKKPAQQPHTLCRYHVAQLRAYTASTRGQVPAAATAPRQRRAATVAAAETGSDFYYYYSGFGPWRGKRRSRHDADGESQIVAEEEEEEDDDAHDDGGGEHVESADNNKDSAKRSDDNVSGDGSNVNNAEGFDVSVEDDNGSAEEDGKGGEEEEEEEKKRKPCHNRKRGRKRIKARSLKSLL